MSFDVLAWAKSHLPGGRVTSSGWYRVKCPWHEESVPSFAVKLDSGNWGCKAASCGKTGGLVALVRHVDGVSWGEAYKKTHLPNPFDPDDDPFLPPQRRVKRAPHNSLPQGLIPVSAERFPSYLRERGYGLQDALDFGLMFGDDKALALRNHLVFPFWTLDGVYKTYTARQMSSEKSRYIQPTESLVSTLLYGVWRFAALPRVERIFVVEGQFDVLRMWKLGLPAVGLSTASATSAQRRQLVELSRQYGVPVCVLLDQGEAEADAAGDIAVHLAAWSAQAYTVALPSGVKDPDELGSPQILLDMCNDREILLREKSEGTK